MGVTEGVTYLGTELKLRLRDAGELMVKCSLFPLLDRVFPGDDFLTSHAREVGLQETLQKFLIGFVRSAKHDHIAS